MLSLFTNIDFPDQQYSIVSVLDHVHIIWLHLHNACSAKNFDLVNIKMFNSIAAARVDDSLVHLVRDREVK